MKQAKSEKININYHYLSESQFAWTSITGQQLHEE